jgi:putative flavoprotein involved in K+ transport
VDGDIYDAANSGRITCVGAAKALTSSGVVVSEGDVVPADRVVFATGYRRDTAWLQDAVTLYENGVPKQNRGISPEISGLAFIGIPCMRTRRSGFIRGFTGDARAIVASIR